MTPSTAPDSLRVRLRGGAPGARGPLVIGPSLIDVHGSSAHAPDPGQALALALRRNADAIVGLQRDLVEAGADLLLAPTACTTAPALHATGQAYRAAALTAAAVDLTRDAALAAGGRAAVVGEVPALPGPRARAEAITHVERLATSAIDAVLVLDDDDETARDAVRAAIDHRLPVIVEVDASRAEAAAAAFDARALPDVVLVRADAPDAAVAAVGLLRAACPGAALGVRWRVAGDDPQGAVLSAWSALASLGLAVVGAGGPQASRALLALTDLAHATRPSTF